MSRGKDIGCIPEASSNADAATLASGLALPLDEARANQKRARERLYEVTNAASRARVAVEEEWAPKVAAARADLQRADAALMSAASAITPDHEWDGQRVVRDKKRRGWGGGSDREEGVVFTYRPGCDLGPGHRYTRPEVGTPFVRLLKKDGKPGAKTVALNDWRGTWKLAPTNTPTPEGGAGHGTASNAGASQALRDEHQTATGEKG